MHTLVIGAEPHSEEQRRRIEDLFGVKAYNSFGLSEMNGPGVAFECTEQSGLHVWEDAYLVEIIDPLTLQPVAPGEIGELVMTTLDRQAMPLIRYRTRDLTRFIPGPCRRRFLPVLNWPAGYPTGTASGSRASSPCLAARRTCGRGLTPPPVPSARPPRCFS